MTKKEIYNKLKKFVKESGLHIRKNGDYVTIFGIFKQDKVGAYNWKDVIADDIKEYIILVRWEVDTIAPFVKIKIDETMKKIGNFW